MAKTINLKYPATCRDCGAELPVGSRARYYGRGRVYGTDCHENDGNGSRSSRTVESTRCEDYPCCGHGPAPHGDGGGCPTRYSDGTETFRCVGCGAELKPGATSALCGRCRNRSRRSDFNWGPLESDPDSFFYTPH